MTDADQKDLQGEGTEATAPDAAKEPQAADKPEATADKTPEAQAAQTPEGTAPEAADSPATAAPEILPPATPEELAAGAGEESEDETPPADSLIHRIQVFLADSTNFYATLGVGLGILAGLVVASLSWHASHPSGPYDLGTLTSTGPGLKGRLFTQWDKNLRYRLSIEPSYPEQLPGFSFAAGNPPRPLSVAIQLRNTEGFVLCDKQILLRYNGGRAAALAASNPPPKAGKDAGHASSAPPAQAANAAQWQAEELARERGKDIFQNQIGSDGQIVSITSEGDLQCSRDSYERAVSWSFAPDFPSVAEQTAMLKHPGETANGDSDEASGSPASKRAAADRRKKAVKPLPNPPVFSISGEDSIVGYDSSAGIVETGSGRTYFIDKTSLEALSLSGRDFPIDIHYRCDQQGACTITGAGVLHVRMRR